MAENEEKKEALVPAVVTEEQSALVKTEKKSVEKIVSQADYVEMAKSFGNIETTPEQGAILFAPVNEDDVEIRPDGLVYLPWMSYVTRLRDAFRTSWGLLPQGKAVMKDGYVMWGFYLAIKGKLAAYAIGECEQTSRMSYGETLEGAKSNAIMRLCKNMGISLELWQPSFIRRWKAKFAEEYFDEAKKKNLWRLRGEPLPEATAVPIVTSVSPPSPAPETSALSKAEYDALPKPSGTVIDAEFIPKTTAAPPPPLRQPDPTGPGTPTPSPAQEEAFREAVKSLPAPAMQQERMPPPPPGEAMGKPGRPEPVPIPPDPGAQQVPGTNVTTATVNISAVNVHKPGPRSRAKNPSYRIIDVANRMYYTFDKTFAVIAHEAMKGGRQIEIQYETTSYGFKIITLKSVGEKDVPLPLGAK